ncbi:MAG: AMP-binding protein, partial [Acidimicrobiales bacterium]
AWLKRRNYAFWMRTGRRLARRRLANGGRLPWPSQAVHVVGWLFLYRSLRERLGLRNVRHCLVGAAAVSPELMDYFHAMGVRMRQAYGQTECGGASHMHRPSDIKYETVGVTLPGYECRTDPETSEVLLAGQGLFSGYWRNPDATAAALHDGWLHTGDLGEIDADGHLRIIGRMKDVIITSGGKNVSPQELENRLRFSPYVKEAIVIGDGRNYLTALIGIEYDTVGHWAEQRGIPYTTYSDLSARQETRDLVSEWITSVNEEVAQVETIKKFRLLPKELDHEDEELTATQKVRRAAIAAKFGDLIDELYA